jgi:hypothetical protein
MKLYSTENSEEPKQSIPGIRGIRAIHGQFLSESFFHPGTGPGAAGPSGD